MGSQILPKLPIIDLSNENMKSSMGTPSWIAACNGVRLALEEYGCFVAVYDRVSPELDKAMFGSLEQLFSLPTETKSQNTSNMPYFGYVGDHPIFPLYESMGIADAATIEAAQSFTNLMWPAGNHQFCETVYSYSNLVSELEEIVKRMVFQSYGVEKYESSCIGSNSTKYLLKMMKYRGPKMNESNIGLDSHTDKSFITILHQNQVNGLEVKAKDGGWIGFETKPSSFVVMAGDAFMVWSNGRIQSPYHRVIMSGNELRYSLGLFSFNNGIIHASEELVDDEHPLQFQPLGHFEYYRFSCREQLGNQFECLVKHYCGV